MGILLERKKTAPQKKWRIQKFIYSYQTNLAIDIFNLTERNPSELYRLERN